MDNDLKHRFLSQDIKTISDALKSLTGELEGDLLIWVLCLKMFHDEAKIRKVAKETLIKLAPEPLADHVKKDRRNYPAIENGKKLLKVIKELETKFDIDGETFVLILLRQKAVPPEHGLFPVKIGVILVAGLGLTKDPRSLFKVLAHFETIPLEIKGSLPAGMSELTSMTKLRIEGTLKKGDHIEELASLPNPLTIDLFVPRAKLSLLLPIKDKVVGLFFSGGYSELSDISALAEFSALSALDVSNTSVTDLSPLKGKPIENLNLRELKAEDYDVLRTLKLKHLDLTRNPMTSPEVIADLCDLETLSISFVEGFKVELLRELKKLKKVEFWGYQIDDLSPLCEANVESLRFIHCRIADLSPIAAIKTLKTITLNTAQIDGDFSADDLKSARPDLQVL